MTDRKKPRQDTTRDQQLRCGHVAQVFGFASRVMRGLVRKKQKVSDLVG
jgi:hypothetical protein